jgi:quinol monooxygenase YgiN
VGADAIEEAIRISVEHVQRSRLEPGCLLHSVHRDVEDPHHLVFLEHWEDRHALLAHFAVPESRAFARALTALADAPPDIEIHEAAPLRL